MEIKIILTEKEVELLRLFMGLEQITFENVQEFCEGRIRRSIEVAQEKQKSETINVLVEKMKVATPEKIAEVSQILEARVVTPIDEIEPIGVEEAIR